MSVLEVGCGTGNVTVRVQRARPGATSSASIPIRVHWTGRERKARAAKRDPVRARLCSGTAVRGRRVRPGAVLDDVAPPGRRDEGRGGERRSSCAATRWGACTSSTSAVRWSRTTACARRKMRRNHADGNLGDAIPRVLRSVGFDCTQVATHATQRRTAHVLSGHPAVREVYRTGLVSDASSSPSSHRTTSPGSIATAPGVPVDRMSPG